MTNCFHYCDAQVNNKRSLTRNSKFQSAAYLFLFIYFYLTYTPKYAHITPVLKSLHWLPVEYRCIFKTATIIYKYLHTSLPKYFSPHISVYTCAANTRHSNPRNKILTTPLYNKSIFKSKVQFNNSFSYNGPNVWNDLPLAVRTAPSLYSFRRGLKSYLFSKAFPP